MVESAGGRPHLLGIASDTLEDLQHRLEQAADADVVVTIGGASVGDHDLVGKALTNSGFELDFWKIAMRPGKPLIHGYVDKIPLLGLPGNPVSSAVCAMVFLRPALAKLSGHDDLPITIAARLLGNLPKNDKRQDYLRATLTYDENGMAEIRPFPRQDSSMIGVFAAANALL